MPSPLNVLQTPINIFNSDSEPSKSTPEETVIEQIPYDLQGVVSNLTDVVCSTLQLQY